MNSFESGCYTARWTCLWLTSLFYFCQGGWQDQTTSTASQSELGSPTLQKKEVMFSHYILVPFGHA